MKFPVQVPKVILHGVHVLSLLIRVDTNRLWSIPPPITSIKDTQSYTWDAIRWVMCI